jgi:hypothetical protein
MSKSPIKAAETRIKAIDDRLKAIVENMEREKREIDLLNRERSQTVAFLNMSIKMRDKDAGDFSDIAQALSRAPTPGRRGRKSNNPDKESIAEKAIEIVKAAGEPLPLDQILIMMRTEGMVFDSKDEIAFLRNKLWLMKDKIANTGTGYWPVGEPLPEEAALAEDDAADAENAGAEEGAGA